MGLYEIISNIPSQTQGDWNGSGTGLHPAWTTKVCGGVEARYFDIIQKHTLILSKNMLTKAIMSQCQTNCLDS